MAKHNRAGQGLAFRWTDGGKASSKRKADRQDCTVRALAVLCSIPYDTAYELLEENGRAWGQGFDLEQWLRRGAEGLQPAIARAQAALSTERERNTGLGASQRKNRSRSVHGKGRVPHTLTPGPDRVLFRQVTFPSIKGHPRVTLEQGLSTVCNHGRWLVSVGRHVFAVIDGVIYDDKLDYRHRKGRCLYAVWAVLPVPPKDRLWLVTLLRVSKRSWEMGQPLTYRKRLGVVAARGREGAYREASRVFEGQARSSREDLFVEPLD